MIGRGNHRRLLPCPTNYHRWWRSPRARRHCVAHAFEAGLAKDPLLSAPSRIEAALVRHGIAPILFGRDAAKRPEAGFPTAGEAFRHPADAGPAERFHRRPGRRGGAIRSTRAASGPALARTMRSSRSGHRRGTIDAWSRSEPPSRGLCLFRRWCADVGVRNRTSLIIVQNQRVARKIWLPE